MRIIDTEDKILSGDNHPQLKIGDKLYLVDDRKTTWDKIQEIQKDESLTDNEKGDKVLALALGKKEYEELSKDKDMTASGYTALTFYVIMKETKWQVNDAAS